MWFCCQSNREDDVRNSRRNNQRRNSTPTQTYYAKRNQHVPDVCCLMYQLYQTLSDNDTTFDNVTEDVYDHPERRVLTSDDAIVRRRLNIGRQIQRRLVDYTYQPFNENNYLDGLSNCLDNDRLLYHKLMTYFKAHNAWRDHRLLTKEIDMHDRRFDKF